MKAETPYRLLIWFPVLVPGAVAVATHGIAFEPADGVPRKALQLLMTTLVYGCPTYLPLAAWATWWVGGKPDPVIRRLMRKAPLLAAGTFATVSLLIGITVGAPRVFAALAATGAVATLMLGYLYVGIVSVVYRAAAVVTVAMIFADPLTAQGAAVVSRVPIIPLEHVVLPAAMQGASAWLVLDPVRGVIVDAHWASRHGHALVGGREAGLGGAATIGGAGSVRREALFVRDLELNVGGVVTKGTRVALALDSLLRESLGHRVDGLVGLDAFGDAIVGVSMADATLTLQPRSSFVAPAGAESLPVRYDGGLRPIITVALILPDGRRVSASAYFDLGMSGVARLTTAFVDRIGLVEALCKARVPAAPDSSETGLGGRLTSIRTVLPSLSFGRAEVETSVVATLARETTGADASPAWDLLLGWGLMRQYDWWFDAVGGRLWYRATDRRNYVRRGSHVAGIEFAAFDDRGDGDLTIGRVDPGSSAERAGVRAGDRLITLDGRRLRARDAAVAGALLSQPPARQLQIARAGAPSATITVAPSMELRAGGACQAQR